MVFEKGTALSTALPVSEKGTALSTALPVSEKGTALSTALPVGNILAGAGESFDDKGSDIRIGCRHGHGAEDTVSLTPGDDPDVIADILL